jgi:LacI family transcriptional regulator
MHQNKKKQGKLIPGGNTETTMRTLADAAGVDVSTVSRALRNDPKISDEQKQRILSIAKESNYKKRKSTASQIAYFIDKRFFLLTSPFYNRVIEGIESESKRNGYSFQFNSLEPTSFSLEGVSLTGIAGMIITSCYHDEFISELKRFNVPMVLIDYYIPTERISSVLVDNVDGIYTAVCHLASFGHRRIAYMKGNVSDIGVRDRLAGFQRAVEALALDGDPGLVIGSDFGISNGYAAMKDFLASVSRPPTAVMCANDMLAIGAMEALKERGLAIPRDVSVMGFDDIDLATEVIPNLSTMHIPKQAMGRLAVQRLMEVIRGDQIDFDKIVVTPRLIVRSSTGAAPK